MLDYSIYNQLNTKAPQEIADAFDGHDMVQNYQNRTNQLAAIAQQQAIGQQQLASGAIDLQQKQQAQSDENNLRQMYKDSGGDMAGMVQQLRAQGLHTQADALVNTLKNQAIANMDMAAKRGEAAHNVAGQVYADPANWKPIIDNAVKTGAIHPDDAAHLINTFQDIPDPAKIKELSGNLMQDTKTQSAEIAKRQEQQFNYDHPVKNPEKIIDNKQNVWMIDNTGKLSPVTDPYTGLQMKAPLPPSVQFQNLSLNPENVEPMAQMVAKGAAPMPTGRAALTGAGAAIVKRALEINPNLDGQTFKTIQGTETNFATGKAGNAIKSFGVSIDHLETLDGLVSALDNTKSPIFNKFANIFATQTGQTAPTNFVAAKKIVADEIVKAIVGSGGGVADREEAAKAIDSANSPEQLRGVISTYKKLMVGQLIGLEQQYKAGGGQQDFRQKFLNDKTRALLPQQSPTQFQQTQNRVINFDSKGNMVP